MNAGTAESIRCETFAMPLGLSDSVGNHRSLVAPTGRAIVYHRQDL
jgi:hypothetical protein